MISTKLIKPPPTEEGVEAENGDGAERETLPGTLTEKGAETGIEVEEAEAVAGIAGATGAAAEIGNAAVGAGNAANGTVGMTAGPGSDGGLGRVTAITPHLCRQVKLVMRRVATQSFRKTGLRQAGVIGSLVLRMDMAIIHLSMQPHKNTRMMISSNLTIHSSRRVMC